MIDMQYIGSLQIKNRSLKQITDLINSRYQLAGDLEIQGDFQEADRKLQYFNEKALILEILDENTKAFYSIPPHYSPEKLIDMIDTNDSSNNNSEGEREYLSECELE
jgi:hypothetical protein